MRTIAPAFALFVLLVILLGPGCNGGGAAALREPDEYLGCATDENWRTFDDYELTGQVKLDDTQAPKLTNLGDGMTLPGSAAATLAWDLSATMPGKATGDASCMKCPNCGPLTIEHEPPVSGDVYDLQFSSDGVLRWRALTTQQTYTFADAAWTQLKGKTVSLRITRMGLKTNDVTDGPYQPTKSIGFTIGN
jgi:hypothetical protein